MATQLGMDPWAIQPRERARYEEQFRALQPVNGIVTGDQVKGFLLQSQLPPQILGHIWNLSDTDADGKMNINEFSIACKLINLKLRNFELPKTLPPSLLQQNKPPGVPMPSTNLLQNVPPAIPPLPLGGLRGPVSPIPPLHPPLSSMGPAPGMMAPLGIPPPVPSTAPLLGGPMVGGQMGVAPSVPPLIGGQMGLSSGIGGGAPLVNMAAGSGVPLLGGLPPVPSNAQLLLGLTQPVSNGAVVMGQGLPPPRPPPVMGAPTAAAGIERGPSIDSPLSLGSPLQEWSVPHQTKLKYTQLFNTSDRTRTGFLSGPQARNIMVQTQLPQPILAQIWSLSDMDADGRLSCDEFVLAMHLCDLAKAGESIPTGLPLELIPPSFRRTRQGSLQGAAPGAVAELIEGKDAASSLPTVTFEDKRKENFDKGQAELERRRKALLDIQRKEQEERERKEKEEMEKRERIRLEQERRRQQELEKQLQKQREVEQEKEEQRKRAQEQRDAARREMERQRQLEWEKQRCQELQHQRQREQEKVLSLKAKNQNLSIELSQLNEKVKELSHKISETRLGVSGVKTTIDGMRSTRDQQMADMSALKTRLKEQNQRLVSLGQEKARMEAKNRMNSATDNANQEQVAIAFSNKQITLKQMRDRLNDLQKEIEVKLSDIENNNSQLGDLKKQLATLVQECEQLYAVYEERKRRVLEMKGVTNRQKESSDLGTSWGETGWNTAPQTTWNTDTEPEWASTAADTTIPAANSNFFKYRALYEFVARNGDELSFQPGDIIMVPVVQNAEPGWLAGEIRGHTGWFPESYVEPLDGVLGTLALEGSVGDAAPAFPPDIIGDTLQGKRPLEGIAEVPENVSDNGSVAEVVGEAGPQITDLASPVLGQGEPVDNVQAQALYAWSARRNNHLSFNKGDIITVKERQELWWFGELNGAQGWFPSNYVQVVALEGTQDADFEQEYHVTLYPYNSVESGDLSFQQGEVVLVVKKEGDWWTGVIGDRQGIFPSNYVQKAEIETQIPAEEVVPSVVELVAKEEVAAVVETPPVAVQAQPLQQEQPPPPSPLPAAKTPTPGTPDFAAMSAQYEDVMEDEGLKRKSSSTSCQSPKCFSFGFASVFSFSELEGKSKKPEIATVIAPYQATSTEQLTLQRGQLIMVRKKTTTGWWEGELQAKGRKRQIGWFPASYVKLLGGGAKGRQDDQPSPLPALQPSPSPQPQASSPPTQQNNIEKVVALYQYAAQNEDELTFEKDDVIVLLAKEEPSWWRGELNGVSGLFPSNYVSPLSTVRLSGRDKKRLDCILELISTEQAYIEDMTIVNEVFEKPLLDSKVLSASDVHKIFVNWKEIIVCNHMFLRALRVRRDMSAGGVIRMIGDILCENLPRMTAYVRFCSCQLSAAKFLQQLTETSAEFREVVKRCQADPRTKGMPLSSFLIKPMQRITKYPLLIKKILEHTPEDHPDRQNVQEALAKAEEFCIQVNEGVREKENSDRLEWLQQYVVCEGLEEELIFNSLTNCLGPRKLLHFGILNKAKSGKELLGFLLNDFLLLAQPSKSLGSHGFSFDNSHSTATFRLYKKPVFLNELQIGHDPSLANSAGDSAEVQTRTLRLQDTLNKTLHVLVTPTCKERNVWLQKLRDAQEDIVDTERKHFQRQQSKQAQFGACGRILVEVVEGVGLRPGSATGRCDAFCEVSMGSQEHRTLAVQATSEARWNATMQFLVKDLKEDVLCITVFDRGHFSPNEFLGRTEVRVADILRETRNDHGPVNTRLQLHEVESGEISLKLDLRLFNREL